MFELLTADGNLPFAVALAIMLFVALLEGVGMLLGAGLSSLIDSLLPDIDLHLDAPDVDSGSGVFTQLLGWLYVGRVPFLVLLLLLLTFFGIAGLMMQSALKAATGLMMPGWLASIPAFVVALPLVRASATVMARVLPQDETEAVSSDTFIGRVATITLGVATEDATAQARLHDQHGQTHYVMVVAASGSPPLHTGEPVLLIKRAGSRFEAISNPNQALVDEPRENPKHP